jgi:hypothetical protein
VIFGVLDVFSTLWLLKNYHGKKKPELMQWMIFKIILKPEKVCIKEPIKNTKANVNGFLLLLKGAPSIILRIDGLLIEFFKR